MANENQIMDSLYWMANGNQIADSPYWGFLSNAISRVIVQYTLLNFRSVQTDTN